jgi:hypothetical protein
MIKARLFPPLLLLLLPLASCQGGDPRLHPDRPDPGRHLQARGAPIGNVKFREAPQAAEAPAPVPVPPGLLGVVAAWHASRRIRRKIARSVLDATPPDS